MGTRRSRSKVETRPSGLPLVKSFLCCFHRKPALRKIVRKVLRLTCRFKWVATHLCSFFKVQPCPSNPWSCGVLVLTTPTSCSHSSWVIGVHPVHGCPIFPTCCFGPLRCIALLRPNRIQRHVSLPNCANVSLPVLIAVGYPPSESISQNPDVTCISLPWLHLFSTFFGS